MVRDQRGQVDLALSRSREVDELAALKGHVEQLEVIELLVHEQGHHEAEHVSKELHALVVGELERLIYL